MNFDISHLLEQWDYQPGEVAVRKFKAKDGSEKIQLRVDLGLLQMNATGRPDGKRPFGHESLLQHYQARLEKYRRTHGASDDGFTLTAEDCAKLQQEAIQYHHRYICLFQLEDYAGVIRDTERNLQVFDFVDRKSTRLNSSHRCISYAVFCLKKKKNKAITKKDSSKFTEIVLDCTNS